ncbi:hypothetical protein BBK36DRAFT_1129434 [Trichoderma citrinoviride]|uniref:Uncharacterized protein n=1 Tax=Trichoderma citrinoviride TaxID=58853 RepID=A0A2T4AZ94_9HYPO|nr:hypothetical protein BBK36DRAFT_1129434 [Trichoderma citrinoviride]PTB62385.1 hypothetical protein BBK36DRAFT_1129434 [Trichoderma citrinoviride]
MTVFSPALPPPSSSSPESSSSSSRSITPPHPSHRVSSSGTVQIVSPGAMTSSSATFSGGGWSPLGRRMQQQRRQRGQYGLGGGVPPEGGAPFWWMDGSTVDLLPRQGDDECERGDLLGGARAGKRGEMRWLVHVVVHGVVLAMQSGVAVGVLTVFAWMGMWRDDRGDVGGVSGDMLRSIPSLATTSVLILSFATLMMHEIYLLSAVVLLYLQAAILALATVAAMSLWMKGVWEENGVAKCVLMSCGMMLWGTSGLAFLRAVVVWKVTTSLVGEDEGVGEGGRSGEVVQGGYATFRGSGSA